MAAITICSDFGAPQIKSDTVSPSIFHEVMGPGPITSWQIDGVKMQAVTDFIFLGSKITVDGDCSHEIRRQLLLARKAMTNEDSVLKIRAITLPTKVLIVKALVFPTVT